MTPLELLSEGERESEVRPERRHYSLVLTAGYMHTWSAR